MNEMKLRPFNPCDAVKILSWCKDKHTFRLWSADRYEDFPARLEEMMKKYKGDNMYPLTAIVGEEIVGHILLRHPSEDKSVIRFGFVIVDDSKRSLLGDRRFEKNRIVVTSYSGTNSVCNNLRLGIIHLFNIYSHRNFCKITEILSNKQIINEKLHV